MIDGQITPALDDRDHPSRTEDPTESPTDDLTDDPTDDP
jgi:hypothetical protein